MPTYYDVTLAANIPYGSNILNNPCTVIFTYPDGSHSIPYAATVFAWLHRNVVRISSAYMNIEAAWVGANGGTLTIVTPALPLVGAITGFVKVP